MNDRSHHWKFFRAGGFDQVKLESAADLARLDELDQKLWVALACPTHGLELDSQTLQLIDTDGNGRIRVPEMIAAAKWATSLLKNPDQLLSGSPSLSLDAINDAIPEGKAILGGAKQILAGLGKKDATQLTLDDVVATEKTFVTTNFDGDGVIPPEAAGDDAIKGVLADIIACEGSETDGGKPGVELKKLNAFFADAQAYSDYWKKIEADKTIMPLGAATAAASVAVKAIVAKVNDFFARCRLAAFDARALPALNRQAWDYMALTEKDLSPSASEFSSFPLAQIAPGKALPLVEGVNPAWAGALAELKNSAVKPFFGDQNSLTQAEWTSLQDKLAPFDKHSATATGLSVEKLGLKRVREILAGNFKQEITVLIDKDLAVGPQANAMRLARYNRDLYTLCLNFVSFKTFYTRKEPAVFQAGRLYMDQRSCDLCLTVADPGKHALLAGLAGAYLAYLDCTRRPTGEKSSIVAVFSQGDEGNLMVGRNGVFYDRKGNDYDATITQIISNPISIRQAFWSPYKKLVRFVESQVAKRVAAAKAAATTSLQSAATVPAAGTAAAPSKIDTGTLAAIGLVLTGLLNALGIVFAKLVGLPVWEVLLAIFLIIIAISAPSVIMAWFKLRLRNLGPILDANGWAVNTRAKLSVPFGASLTQAATLPPGSERDLRDPYRERKPYAKIIAIIVLIIVVGVGIAWYRMVFDGFLSSNVRGGTVRTKISDLIKPGTNAPPEISATNSSPAHMGTNAPPAK